jgi:Protein of unknown function (DUF2851)
MTEQLFQFIWQYKLFSTSNILQTIQGENIQIISVGNLNNDAGPDFTNAKIKIGNTTWAGDVELHLKSTDWIKHQHQQQDSYQKIILHVVYEHNTIIKDKNGHEIPTIELKNAIAEPLLQQYYLLMNQTQALACGFQFASLKSITIQQQLDRVLIERLMVKSDRIQQLLKETNNDWNEVFYISIARAFGSSVNAEAFQSMAVRIPLKILAKHKSNLLQIEAMLYGVAGLIPQHAQQKYILELQQEFNLLQTKFNLVPMDATRFKFMRMRPANFPSIRIAQFANLIFQSSQLLSKVLDSCFDLKLLLKLFDAEASTFWQNHYTFLDEAHVTKIKNVGKSTISHIIINTVCPIIYEYGKYMGETKYCEAAIQLLHELPAEKNKFTEVFSSVNYKATSAFQSQAMLQQYQMYCTPKKCLQCAIGFSIIKK